MCKFCRFQKCRQSGMNPDEVRSGSNSPANTPPPKGFSTPNPPPIIQHQQQQQYPSTSMPSIQISIPNSSPSLPSIISTKTTTTNSPTPFQKAFQRAIVLENSLFVAVKNPVLLSAYLQPPHDPKLLEIALKNFQKVSDRFSTFNNFFMFQYIESAGIILDAKMVEKFPAVNQLINQSLQQYSEIIKIRVRNEFEFAALCQLSLLKITSEEFPHFQNIITKNYEIVEQNFRNYYANELGENASISLSNVLDLANTIHLIRKTYRNQICALLRSF